MKDSIENKIDRLPGYYWLRDGNDWQIAAWDGDNWLLPGHYKTYTDAVWDEIDESPITRVSSSLLESHP